MKTEELFALMPNPDRVRVIEKDKTEIWSGYVGNWHYNEVLKNRTVHSLSFKCFAKRKENVIPREKLDAWECKDIDFLIYQEIVLEPKEKEPQ